ncbi:hypothetical protein SprV_0301232200 [Sparganum proliferum]
MAAPAQLHLTQLGVDAEDPCSSQYVRIRIPVLPQSKTAEVEVVEHPRLPLVRRSGPRSIQQRRQDDLFVHLQFGAEVEMVTISDGVL